MSPCIMNHQQISFLDFRKHTIHCEFIIVFTKRTCHIILMVTWLVFFSHNCNVVICPIHSRAHKVHRTGIHSNIFLMGVFFMDGFGYQTTIRPHHKSSKLCVNGNLSHSCRNQDFFIGFPDTLSNSADIIRLLVRCIRNTYTA